MFLCAPSAFTFTFAASFPLPGTEVTVCYLEPREQSARARRRRIAAQFDFECICKLCSAASTGTDTTYSTSYYAPLEATVTGKTTATADEGNSSSSSASEGNSSSSDTAAAAAAAAAADDTLAEELDALESAIAAAGGNIDRPVAWGSVLKRALM
jgi:hypothetical protein